MLLYVLSRHSLKPVQAPEHAWLSVVGVFDELYATQQLSGPQVGWVVIR